MGVVANLTAVVGGFFRSCAFWDRWVGVSGGCRWLACICLRRRSAFRYTVGSLVGTTETPSLAFRIDGWPGKGEAQVLRSRLVEGCPTLIRDCCVVYLNSAMRKINSTPGSTLHSEMFFCMNDSTAVDYRHKDTYGLAKPICVVHGSHC